MKELYPEALRCAYELCKRSDPIEVTPGHRRRQYHDENCRQAQHRLREARRIYETLCQVWAPFLPETQQVLEDLLGQHGEIWTRRVIAVITAERDQAGRPSLSEDEQAALRQQWADLQPFTRNILEGLLTQQHERLGLLNLITLAIGEERTHAMCNSELEQRAAYLEIMLTEYRRIIDLEHEEKIGQQFMTMGELLGYRALLSYRLGEGIEQWRDYRSWTDERTLAEVIVYGRELLAQEAAVKETTAQKSKMRQAEQRLVVLEQRTKEQQERIAELERQVEPHETREAIHQECDAAADRLRHRIVELEHEVTQQRAMSEAQEQNIENYRKKLAQAGERISKLERQVDVQRQQLGQYHRRFYPSSGAVAERRLMALGAALNYKILLKYDSVAVEVPSGEQAWREFATHACYEDVAQAILQAQYLFDNLQALGMLAKRDSLVDHA